MKARPFLLPALLLWGWQVELLPWAVGMGLLLEGPRFAGFRLEIDQRDFNRLWNFTILLFLGVGLYVFLAREGLDTVGDVLNAESPASRLDGMRKVSQTAIAFLSWLPFIFYPFVLVHAWSRTERLPWSTFSLYEQARARRRPEAASPDWAVRRIHPGHPYLGVVLFASSAAINHPRIYLPAFVGVVLLAVWPWRNRRYGGLAWVGLVVLLGAASLLAQHAVDTLRAAYMAMENRLMQGLSGSGDFDPLRHATSLGRIGRLKQSAGVVLRIRTEDGGGPGLLREAVYNKFGANVWVASHVVFRDVTATRNGDLWQLTPSLRSGRSMTISRFTSGGEAPLALPEHPLNIRGLESVLVETNLLGSARLKEAASLALYTVDHGEGGGLAGEPLPEDTSLATLKQADRAVINEVAGLLDLPGKTPREAIEAVRAYLRDGFVYSLWQGGLEGSTEQSALARFLRETKTGHCEYFATATTLLLRAAGVPTRYAVGFSPSRRHGDAWLARGRDAHAWCLAHVEGAWQSVDTTPGIWRSREEAAYGDWWESGVLWFSELRYRFVRWRQEGGNWRVLVFAAGVLILTWLGLRQLRGSRWRRVSTAPRRERAGPNRLGLDSEFFEVTKRLEARHGQRLPHETLQDWTSRLGMIRGPMEAPLGEAMQLHARLRFDPAGLTTDERARLRRLVDGLLARLERGEAGREGD